MTEYIRVGTRRARLTVIAMLVFATGSVHSQGIDGYEFISPVPGSTSNSLESTIIIRQGAPVDETSLRPSALAVVGSTSGQVDGRLFLSSDGKTIIFSPDHPFAPAERIAVSLNTGILTEAGERLESVRFSFTVAPFARTPNPYALIPELKPNYLDIPRALKSASADSIPDNFPAVNVEVIDSTAIGEGYIFLTVSGDVEGVGYYLMMLNNDGTPFFYRELEEDFAYDFKMQPNGRLSYAHFFEHLSYTGGGNVVHKILDSSFALVDSVRMGNGYVAEAHDFQILPNGHFLLFGYYLTPVDMSLIVDGGQPDALVSGGIVQELDAEKNVVFQWRSWDHFSFEERTFNPNQATRSIVSHFHLNSINLDDDGHILIGTPSWAKKINRQTGDVIWNLGGADNEFSFVNVDSSDGVGFVGGHTFYRLPNGNVLIYDNGNRQGTRSSRVNELRIDEEAKTVELVWSYIPDEVIAGRARGSAQRLPNGNTVIGWGGGSQGPIPAFTEVTAAGEKVYELSFVSPQVGSYRAFRFPFTAGTASATMALTEVAPGNEYDFAQGDTVDTGVSIRINTLDGSGYNELSVSTYEFAPVDPEFHLKAPRVIPKRMVLAQFGLTGLDIDVQFDIQKWSVVDPENTVIYHREFEGSGLFLPLVSSYNPAKGIIVANSTKIGEFILTTIDFASVIFAPVPVTPVDSASVNQTLPVAFEWTPIGYVNSYELQVSTDAQFSSLLVDEAFLTGSRYTITSVEAGTDYFWRVRATNDAGMSAWSGYISFSATAPFIDLTEPDGAEEWQKGLDVWIRWTDNVEENVAIQLRRGEVVVDTLAVTASDGAYRWEVDLSLPTGSNYRVSITSVDDLALTDMSLEAFDIVDSPSVAVAGEDVLPDDYALHQNYPNPFNPVTRIVFEIPAADFVYLAVFDLTGRRVVTLVEGLRTAGIHESSFDASALPSGVYLYRLETPGFSKTQKMILLK